MLAQLGRYDASTVAIVNAGVLQPLVKLVREGSVDLHDEAERALMILTGSREEYMAQIELASGFLNKSMIG